MSNSQTTVEILAGDLIMKRRIAARRELVYAAWTQAQQLARWFGPHHVVISECSFDGYVGGQIRIVMLASDGSLYPMNGTIVELSENERLVMNFDLRDHPPEWHSMMAEQYRANGGNGDMTPIVRIEVDFIESSKQGEHTDLIIRQCFNSDPESQTYLKMGSVDGWSQSFEKLQELCQQS